MRLIDADKLYFDCTTFWGYPTFGKSQIENAPTISAVPIPDGATNGDMIKALFPKVVAKQHITSLSLTEAMRAGIDCDVYTSKYKFFTLWFPSEWWNAPYKAESEDKE